MANEERKQGDGSQATRLPHHIAIIMDGNGRWATQRKLPRFAGHRAGVESVRAVVSGCAEKGIQALTLFAFSSENWRRPREEVGLLMSLFTTVLQREVKRLHRNNVRLRIIGDRLAFDPKLQQLIADAEALTAANSGLTLTIAANYGGRWDITQACQRVAEHVAAGELQPADVDERTLGAHLSLAELPEPDLFIRTGGEQRVSNFLLWQLAYTELFFTPVLWPDFNRELLEQALASFAQRQRRFGHTGDQTEQIAQLETGRDA